MVAEYRGILFTHKEIKAPGKAALSLEGHSD